MSAPRLPPRAGAAGEPNAECNVPQFLAIDGIKPETKSSTTRIRTPSKSLARGFQSGSV